MKDPQIPNDRWKEIWDRYHSEINIEIVHCLTEPVCPTAVIVIESTGEKLLDTMSMADTIEEAVERCYKKFEEKYL